MEPIIQSVRYKILICCVWPVFESTSSKTRAKEVIDLRQQLGRGIPKLRTIRYSQKRQAGLILPILPQCKNPGADPGFGQGGPQLPRLKVADVAGWSRASKASYLRPWSRARSRALEAFEFLVLKYAFSHILELLFLSFLISTSRPKTYNYYTMRNDMPSEARLENFWMLIVKNSKILKKKYAKWSKAKKFGKN